MDSLEGVISRSVRQGGGGGRGLMMERPAGGALPGYAADILAI